MLLVLDFLCIFSKFSLIANSTHPLKQVGFLGEDHYKAEPIGTCGEHGSFYVGSRIFRRNLVGIKTGIVGARHIIPF